MMALEYVWLAVSLAYGAGYAVGRLLARREIKRLERMTAKALQSWADEADKAEKLEGERNEARRKAASYKVQLKCRGLLAEEEDEWPDVISG